MAHRPLADRQVQSGAAEPTMTRTGSGGGAEDWPGLNLPGFRRLGWKARAETDAHVQVAANDRAQVARWTRRNG